MNKPNIVFFFTDDLRFDTIHALGNEQIITPNLDKLVSQSVSFTQAHIPSGTSPAVCMPSRAMLNTGRTLFHLDKAGEEIPDDHALLGETLRKNGYHTYGIGKWHNGKKAYNRSFCDGSKIFFGGMTDHWQVPSFEYDCSGQYSNKIPRCKDCFHSNELEYINADTLNSGKHSTDILQEAACNFVENYKGENPYYLYYSFLAPHDPRTMPQKYLDMYADVDIKLPENFMEVHPFDNGELDVRDERLAEFPRNKDEIKRHLKEYYAMITHVDDAIGKVISSIEKSGQLENTVFIFSGDNGLALGQHGLMGKQSLYNHSIRVPLMFSGKNIPKNVQCDKLTYLLDIYPTICEMLDIPIPSTVDGHSLWKTINNPNHSIREDLYLAYTDKHRGVTDAKYKLIEYAVSETAENDQFFDLINDPYELNNLYNSKEYANLISQYKEKLLLLSQEWHDREHIIGSNYWKKRDNIDK